MVHIVLLLVGLQADERHRRNAQGSPQAAGAQKQPPAVGPQKQPPAVPPRAETFSNGSASESAQPSLHRPMEPQVTTVMRHLGYTPKISYLPDVAESDEVAVYGLKMDKFSQNLPDMLQTFHIICCNCFTEVIINILVGHNNAGLRRMSSVKSFITRWIFE